MLVLTAPPVGAEVAELGESPRWDGNRGELLTVDIVVGHVLRWAWTGTHLELIRRYEIGPSVGAVARWGAGYLLAAGNGFRTLDVDGGGRDLAWDAASPGTRMNDGACDPRGRFWAGTMPWDTTRTGAGTLYRLDLDGSVQAVRPGVTVSNGLAWNSDGTRMYYADSADSTVWLFDFDLDSGAISRRRAFATFADGVPDGLCRDDEDHVWVAVHGAGEVRRYAPDGSIVATVGTPGARQVTSCALGGADGQTLFVTTATIGQSAADLIAQPDAGRIHAVRVPVPGPPATPYAGSIEES